uniref:E3 ubiquitin-protein ligase TRIM7-like n=1 Tax=Myxine glutinosa TaxID=7769 RepID=UPI00358E4D1D
MAFSLMTGVCADELQCIVCLELYEEPITLPCGHSFCKVCIKQHWESREEATVCDCPNCREVFPIKPECQKNVALAKLVEKTKLVPGVNVGERRCTEHGKPIQLYCKDDESLMCVMCLVGQHKNHEVVPVEIVHDELKGVLAAKCPELSKSKQHLESQLHQLKREVEQTRDSGKETVDRMEEKRLALYQYVDKSVDLMKSSVIKRQNEKICLLQKQMDKVKEQLNSFHETNFTLKAALQDLVTVSFLRGYKDVIKRLESVSHFQSLKMAQPTLFEFSKEEKNLGSFIELHENFLKNIRNSACGKGLVSIHTLFKSVHVYKLFLKAKNIYCINKQQGVHIDCDVALSFLLSTEPVELQMSELDQSSLRRLYGRTPSLDPNSANPWIKISRDLRTATRTETDNHHPEHPDRFDFWLQVLCSESFSSGRHYWEVDVRSSSSWGIGICLNSMGRKGEGKECMLGGNPKSWCLQKYQNKYYTRHNNQRTLLSVPGDPERFGFLLDCEEGEFTCFGDSRVLHVFRGNFLVPVKPAIGVYGDVGHSVRFCSF